MLASIVVIVGVVIHTKSLNFMERNVLLLFLNWTSKLIGSVISQVPTGNWH